MGPLSIKQTEFSFDIATLILYAHTSGVLLTFGHAYRDQETQRRLVETGKSWTMNSDHLKRLAVDFNFFIDGALTYNDPKIDRLGEYWVNLRPGNYWGGHFDAKRKDTPHFGRK